MRARGSNTGEPTPLADLKGEDPWQDLWFHSNPVFIDARCRSSYAMRGCLLQMRPAVLRHRVKARTAPLHGTVTVLRRRWQPVPNPDAP